MKTILIIEDDQLIRESIVELLETRSYRVLSAGNGIEGISVAIENQPDLIVCDVMMPGLDGYEVVASIRNEKKLAEVPFIFLSAKTQRLDLRKAMNLGADDYLTKPFKAQELFEAIEARLKRNESGEKKLTRTKNELERLNQQLLAISEASIPVSIITTDLDGTILYFSKGAERLLGYTADEMVNVKSISVLHVKKEIAQREEELRMLLGKEVTGLQSLLAEIPNQKKYDSQEWTYVRKNGTTFPVQLALSNIHDSTGGLIGHLAISIDISERKSVESALYAAKEEAERANRYKSQFMANISHEIRTPMNAILGFSDLLLKNTTDPKSRNHLTTIVTSGKTLMSLINDLLDLAKIESGKMTLHEQAINLKSLVNEVVEMFTNEVNKKSISLDAFFQSSLPDTIFLDDVRVRQILTNVISNAVKFTHSGFIRVTVEFKHSRQDHAKIDVTITIQDSGIGIEEENQQLIFESFQQVHDTTTSQYGGTGLGLTITKRLVELMNGEMSVKSKQNEGSTFTIVLPGLTYLTSAVPTYAKQPKKTKSIKFKPSTLLVVDDVEMNIDLMTLILEEHPFNIITARNGLEAVEKAELYKPDLIMMDLRMPVMDGKQAAAKIKSKKELSHIPIIACTASILGNEQLENTFAGMISKPMKPTALYEELQKFLPHEVVLDHEAHEGKQILLSAEEKTLLKPHLHYIKENFGKRIMSLASTIDVLEMEKLLEEIKQYVNENQLIFFNEPLEVLTTKFDQFDLDAVTNKLNELINIISD